jgi:hypothetical protein
MVNELTGTVGDKPPNPNDKIVSSKYTKPSKDDANSRNLQQTISVFVVYKHEFIPSQIFRGRKKS